jgi:hypothetical protein
MEGCLKCHNNIEPMHRYNARGDVFDTLDGGKDAQGFVHLLSRLEIRGDDSRKRSRPAAYPRGMGMQGRKVLESKSRTTNTLLTKESSAFVRFINPETFRVVAQSCG